jgi:tetratricopeptide (TPR) repeat protein
MRRFILAFLLGFSATTSEAAVHLDTLWEVGRDAYATSDYHKATETFIEILTMEPTSVAAMYNLGNCYLELGDAGRSILWYERALKYQPTDQDVRHNLAIAKTRRANPVIEIRHFFLLRWIRGVANQVSTVGWGLLAIAFFWGALFFLAKSILQKSWKSLRGLIIICGCMFFLSLVFGGRRYTDMHRQDLAIIVASNATMLVAPDQESKRISDLGAGEKVMILDSLQQYYKIRLANFEQGWMQKSAITKI